MRSFMGWVAPGLRHQDAAAFDEMVEDGFLATRSLRPRRLVPPLPLTDAQWARYQSRTLFLAGADEVVFDARRAVAKLARVAPHVETALFEGVGHDLIVVRTEEVNRRVRSFLTG
jgi:pimeloyl-ACP methyl ester carboxylesterase